MPARSSSSLARAPARRHAPRAERRTQIALAALRCFSEKGFHATTMDDVVRASGLSKGSLYWHFENKEEVFLAVFDLLAEKIFGRFDAALEHGAGDLLQLLEHELAAFLEEFGAQRELLLAWAEFLSHPRGRERMAEIYRVSREKLSALVRIGVERGELRDLSPEGVAAVLTGVADALVLQAAVDPDFDLRDHLKTLWEVLRGGIGPAERAPHG
jgi:AcrR family transcriptional regulator